MVLAFAEVSICFDCSRVEKKRGDEVGFVLRGFPGIGCWLCQTTRTRMTETEILPALGSLDDGKRDSSCLWRVTNRMRSIRPVDTS